MIEAMSASSLRTATVLQCRAASGSANNTAAEDAVPPMHGCDSSGYTHVMSQPCWLMVLKQHGSGWGATDLEAAPCMTIGELQGYTSYNVTATCTQHT